MVRHIHSSQKKRENPIKTALMLLLITVLLIVAFPFMIPGIIRGISLRVKFQQAAKAQSKFVLFVYSNSSIWQEYIESSILPKIHDYAFVLNWSQRSQWDKSSWMVKAFEHWGGQRDFNPMAIVFRNFFAVSVIRFYRPFLDQKHGRSNALRQAETQLLSLVEKKAKSSRSYVAA